MLSKLRNFMLAMLIAISFCGYTINPGVAADDEVVLEEEPLDYDDLTDLAADPFDEENVEEDN